MDMKIIIGFLFIGLLISGCNAENKTNSSLNILEINPIEAQEKVKLSEFVDSVKYIRLQTDSNCVMGRIAKLIIKNKYIYACDVSQMVVFVFDKQGNYVSKLDKRGKGPDEYLNFAGVFIDDNEEFIEVFTRRGKFIKYSNLSFNLIDKNDMDPVFSNSSRKINNTYYFATQQNQNIINGKKTNAGLVIVRNNKVKKTLFDKKIDNNNLSFSAIKENLTINDKNELFVSIMYDNNFYQIQDLTAFPVFSVDFGGYGIDNSIGKQSIKEQMAYLNEKAEGKAFLPVLTINNTKILAITYNFFESKDNRYPAEYIVLKEKNQTFHARMIENDISDFPAYVTFSTRSSNIYHEIWHENYLINIIIPANEFMYSPGEKYKIVEGLGTITPEDNPIIILMKLKDELI